MASNTVGTNNTRGGQEKGYHVDNSHLLALIRNQMFEGEGRARAHLAVCEQCQRAYVEQAQTSRTLDVLGQMAQFQQYPEMQSRAILIRAQESLPGRMSRSRQQAARSAYGSRGSFRWVSLPVSILMLLMTIVVVVAFALAQFGTLPFLPGVEYGHLFPHSPTVLPLPRHSITPTAGITKAVSPTVPSAGTTPSPTNGDQPTVIVTTGTTPTPPVAVTTPTPAVPTAPNSIYVCTTQRDWTRHILDICGNNFIPGDKVQLVVTAQEFKHPVSYWTLMVNSYGQFTFHWYVWNCNWDPSAVYVQDISSKPPVSSNTLDNLTMQDCSIQTGSPTPTPGDH